MICSNEYIYKILLCFFHICVAKLCFVKKIEASAATIWKAPTQRKHTHTTIQKMASLTAPASHFTAAAAVPLYPPPLAGLYAVASGHEDHTHCSPDNCSLAAAPLAVLPPPPLPPVLPAVTYVAPSGLGPAPSSIPDHSHCGRECSLLHGLKPTDPLYRELIAPALRNEALRFKEHMDKQLTAGARGAAAAGGDEDAYDGYNSPNPPPLPLTGMFAPVPRTAADYNHQSHTIIHYLKTCGRFDRVEAADASLLEDPEYPDAVFYIHLRDPMDDNAEHNIYFFSDKTFTGCPNEFLRTVIQTWLDGVRAEVGGEFGFMEVRYSLRPV